MTHTFLSYRRADDPEATKSLHEHLVAEFGSADIFLDVTGSIQPGAEFRQTIENAIRNCEVLLVVIGPSWSDILVSKQGDPFDMVVTEIKTALRFNKHVVPVLVSGAGVPASEILPKGVGPLIERNAITLRNEYFGKDCQLLTNLIRRKLTEKDAQPDRLQGVIAFNNRVAGFENYAFSALLDDKKKHIELGDVDKIVRDFMELDEIYVAHMDYLDLSLQLKAETKRMPIVNGIAELYEDTRSAVAKSDVLRDLQDIWDTLGMPAISYHGDLCEIAEEQIERYRAIIGDWWYEKDNHNNFS